MTSEDLSMSVTHYVNKMILNVFILALHQWMSAFRDSEKCQVSTCCLLFSVGNKK